MPNALCMPLLREPAAFPADALRAAWRSAWPDVELREVTERDAVLAFETGGATCAVSLMPLPVPGDEVLAAARASWLWPGAEAESAAHGAHAVVFASHDDGLAACVAASRAASAVLGAAGGLGVYVGSAGMLVRADVWTDMTRELDPPLPIWVNVLATSEGRMRRRRSAAYTAGLEALGMWEIEIVGSRDKPGVLREWLLDIAAYVASGAVLADGDTIGGSEDERIRVRHAPSAYGRAGIVYALDAGA